MAHLYPSLHEKFRIEGLCPICLIEMAHTPRFSCANSHVICHRCRPYYYSCPQCLQPLSEIPPDSPTPFEPPPPTHFMPQPYPPTAPDFQEFYHHERQNHNWQPPSPPREDQELIECPYTHLGCTAKFVPQLRSLHVSRCQYKHHSEAPDQCEQPQDSESISCRYQPLGCIVRAPRSRLHSHEELCVYKDRSYPSDPVAELGEHLEGSCHLETDPNQMVDCRFHFRGCRVRMPLWRKESHEAKCNHQTGDGYEEPPEMSLACWDRPMPMPQQMLDPEEQTECRWAKFGCRVRPNYERKVAHEEKCNYRMEECSYKHRGCDQLFQPSRRYAHESSCGYA